MSATVTGFMGSVGTVTLCYSCKPSVCFACLTPCQPYFGRPRVDATRSSSPIGRLNEREPRASRSLPEACVAACLSRFRPQTSSSLRPRPAFLSSSSLSSEKRKGRRRRQRRDDGYDANACICAYSPLPTRTHYRRPCRALYRRRLAYAIIAARDVCVSTPVLSCRPDHRLPVLDTRE